MSMKNFWQVLQNEVARLDQAGISKRDEKIIEGFTAEETPRAIIGDKKYYIFNSNDYLGLRHHEEVKAAEVAASAKFGAGPGAVRFISGSMSVHQELERALAKFHGREEAMVISSAFAANLGVLFSLAKGQSKDSLVSDKVLILSDELNHRSIIDGIRLGNLASDQKAVFKHLDMADADRVLTENKGKFDRVLVVTDGVFSMLGEYQKLDELRQIVNQHDANYPEGVILIVDDCHGVGSCGATGRGTEEVKGAKADVLVGTMGKGFGVDGGYIVADKVVIDYLRESVATYIYSNPIAPGTAGASLAAVELLDKPAGKELVAKLASNTALFKEKILAAGFTMASQSTHPIQPLLMGDPILSKAFSKAMFELGFIVTSINYPVVAKGKDEIRVQISAEHSPQAIEEFVAAAVKAANQVGLKLNK